MKISAGYIDMHGHAYRKPSPFPVRFTTIEELLAIYDQYGIEKGIVQPLIGPETYMPQANEDILDMAEKYPERIVPFCNIDPRLFSNPVFADYSKILGYYLEKGVKGVGEFMPNLPFLDVRVQAFLKSVNDFALPLCFDSRITLGELYGLYDEVGLPQLELTLKRFSRITFIGHGPPFWAEIGRIRKPADRDGYPSYPIEEEGVVPMLMRQYDNLWADLSARSGFNALNRDHKYAVTFLNEFQDRLMFGTDICSPQIKDIPQIKLLKKFLDEGSISEVVFRKIMRENALRLLKINAS